MPRLDRSCRSKTFGVYRDLYVTRLEILHAAIEHNAAAIDEHEISEDMLDVLHLMCRHENGAVAIKIVIQKRIVKLLAIKNVETQGGLIEHQQFRVYGHHQRKM